MTLKYFLMLTYVTQNSFLIKRFLMHNEGKEKAKALMQSL